MQNVIFGNFSSALTIYAYLKNIKHESVKIFAKNNTLYIPHIMLMKIKNKDDLKLYSEIFDCDVYAKTIKVGYFYKGKIYDTASDEMIESYLKKQHRNITASCMSNKNNEFYAINLYDIYHRLFDECAIDTELVNSFDDLKFSNSIIYDTVNEHKKFINANDEYNEYILVTLTDLGKYTYIYDCSPSNIKRISATCVEYIKKPEAFDTIKIRNFYSSPKIFSEYDVVNNNKHIILGRGATHTQIKQTDIIQYMNKF